MSETFSPRPSLTILAPRGRGRPRAEAPSTGVSTWLPVRDYQRLLQLAKANEQSLSSLVRDLLKLKVAR